MARGQFSALLAGLFILLAQPAAAQFYSNDGHNVMEELATLARVKVSAGGGITFDDKSVTQAELEQALDRLKKVNGAVLYYRERATGEAPAGAMDAFRAILGAGVPVSLSTEPDFSDYVDPQGNVHKRRPNL
jgi:hypothetical protein